MKQYFAVYDNTNKETSSFLKQAIQFLASVVLGVDTFKSAWKQNPGDPETAVAQSTGNSNESLRAKLAVAGINPELYFAALGKGLPVDIDTMSADEINKVLADAQMSANDPSQMNWLWAIGGLLLIIGLGTANKKGAFRRMAGHARSSYHRARRRFSSRRGWRRGRR